MYKRCNFITCRARRIQEISVINVLYKVQVANDNHYSITLAVVRKSHLDLSFKKETYVSETFIVTYQLQKHVSICKLFIHVNSVTVLLNTLLHLYNKKLKTYLFIM